MAKTKTAFVVLQDVAYAYSLSSCPNQDDFITATRIFLVVATAADLREFADQLTVREG